MKKSILSILPKLTPKHLTLAVLGAACAAHAATGPLADPSSAGGPVSSELWNLLIPVAVPLVIAGVKWVLPKIPGWWLPILAPVLGAGLEIVLHFAGLATGNGVAGALLGAAGVGLREIVDQVRKMQGQMTNGQ